MRKMAVFFLVGLCASALGQGWVPRFEGKSAGQWLEALDSRNDERRADAIWRLAQGGEDAVPVLRAWLRVVYHRSAQSEALEMVMRIGPDAEALMPDLLECSKSLPQILVGIAFGCIGKPAVPFLLSALENEAVSPRAAVEAFRTIGADAAPAVPAILRLLKVESKECSPLALACLDALGEIGVCRDDVIGSLKSLLSCAEPRLLLCSVAALARLGERDKETVHRLLPLLSDPCPSVRARVARGLGQIGSTDPKIVVALRECTTDEVSWVRVEAVLALCLMGQGDDELVLALARGVTGPESSFRSRDGLAQLGPGAKAATEHLIEGLSSKYWAERVDSARILGDVEPHSRLHR